MFVTCPTDSRWEDDVVGCGHFFDAEPDDEGYFDCPACGLFFRPVGDRKNLAANETAYKLKTSPDEVTAISHGEKVAQVYAEIRSILESHGYPPQAIPTNWQIAVTLMAASSLATRDAASTQQFPPPSRVRVRRHDGGIVEDSILAFFNHPDILEPYARNTLTPAVVLASIVEFLD